MDAWVKIFNKIELDNFHKEKVLDEFELRNPAYPVTRLMFWIYAMSSYIYWDLRESTLKGSYDRVDTLGPFR